MRRILSKALRLAATPGGVLAFSAVMVFAEGSAPRIIPFPEPPTGPKISRVSHDATRPVKPGDRIRLTILAEPALKVTVSIGGIVRELACPADPDGSAYSCEATIPEGASAGSHRPRASVTDAKGRSSTLSAILPVVVKARNALEEADAVNVRLMPVYFKADSAEIDAASREALKKNADLISAHSHFPVLIEGHADASEPGDRLALSERRARAVSDLLVSLGVEKNRLKVTGSGDSHPLLIPRDDSERAMNRRVMVLLAPPPAL